MGETPVEVLFSKLVSKQSAQTSLNTRSVLIIEIRKMIPIGCDLPDYAMKFRNHDVLLHAYKLFLYGTGGRPLCDL